MVVRSPGAEVAMTQFGIGHLDMPLTPERLWRALRGATAKAA